MSFAAQLPITGIYSPVWLAPLLHFPACNLLESKALPLGWLLDPEKSDCFTNRILARLVQAEAHELDPWLRDDIRIAWIATLYASEGNPQSFVDATYAVLGLHPDKVYPAILARREALLGIASMREPEAGETRNALGQNTVSPVLRLKDLPCNANTGALTAKVDGYAGTIQTNAPSRKRHRADSATKSTKTLTETKSPNIDQTSQNRESSEAARIGSTPATLQVNRGNIPSDLEECEHGQDYAPAILTSTGELGTNRKQPSAKSKSSQSSILATDERTAPDAERAPQNPKKPSASVRHDRKRRDA